VLWQDIGIPTRQNEDGRFYPATETTRTDHAATRPSALLAPQRRAFSRPHVHADLRRSRRAGLVARMGAWLRRPAEICDARLCRVRAVFVSGRLARRQMEPGRHDDRLLCRDWANVDPDRTGAKSAA